MSSGRRLISLDVDVDVAVEALTDARRLSEISRLVYSLTNLGSGDLRAGHATRGQVQLERAITLAKRHGLEGQAARAIASLVSSSLRTRGLADAGTYLDRGFDYCAETGLDDWRVLLLAYRARLELHRGTWTAAAESAATVLRDTESQTAARALALATLGVIRARRGDPGAGEALHDAGALVQPPAELDRFAAVAAATAESAWLHDDNEAVAPATDHALRLAVKLRAPWIAGELAWHRFHAGLHQILPGDAIAHPYGLSLAGDWAGAAHLWTSIGCPYEAALALAASTDKPARSQAIDELRKLGARRTAAIINRRDRTTPSSPRRHRRTTRQNPAGLTARELEVLSHVAAGLRNAEIARELVLSPRTVDHHVSALLRKLGARTRLDASLHAKDLGIISIPPAACVCGAPSN